MQTIPQRLRRCPQIRTVRGRKKRPGCSDGFGLFFRRPSSRAGRFGELWGKHVATVYVRPQRHTHFFMDMCDTFSISFLPEADHRIMEYCGKKSGREVDKAAETGLRPIFDHNTILFEQSELTIVCRKLYVQRIDPAGFIDRECDTKNYPNHDYHDMYIGEIIGIYRAQS